MAITPTYMFGNWIGLLAVSGMLTGLPLGVPPLPEDPAISRVAPAECLWYFASAGMATPDRSSENQTEQLLAEPELQELAQTIETQILRAVRRNVHSRGERVLSEELPKLVKTALTRPLAVYVSEIRPPGPDGPPSGRAGLVVSLGDRSESTGDALEKLEKLAFGGNAPQPTIEGDIALHRVPAPPCIPPVQWAIVNGYLIVGVGEGEAAAIVERQKSGGSPPEWLQVMRSELAPDRVSTIGYVNVAGLVTTFGPLLGDNRTVLSKLGLDSVEAIYSTSGLDERACVSRVKIAIDGEPEGVFALLPQKPLSKRDIELIPGNATAAAALRFDADETFDQVLDLVDSFDRDARDEFEEGLREIESAISVDIREDLLGAVDDVWIAYLPGGNYLRRGSGRPQSSRSRIAIDWKRVSRNSSTVPEWNSGAGTAAAT